MKYLISTTSRIMKGTVKLPSSKSISNRALIIGALSYSPFPIRNLSDSDDTEVLMAALNSDSNKFDIGHAGTAMRFLTAFLSKIVGEWEITGSERMKQRPIKILVDALNRLGAKIEYLENEGYPPLKIYGSRLKGQTLELDGSISSQYISALLIIAPTIENGLTLRLTGNITSRSYIELTLKLMEKFGIRYQWEGNEITVREQHYFPFEFTVEADWSGASYWYQLLAVAEKGEIFLENLQLNSLQGDANIAGWFEQFEKSFLKIFSSTACRATQILPAGLSSLAFFRYRKKMGYLSQKLKILNPKNLSSILLKTLMLRKPWLVYA